MLLKENIIRDVVAGQEDVVDEQPRGSRAFHFQRISQIAHGSSELAITRWASGLT